MSHHKKFAYVSFVGDFRRRLNELTDAGLISKIGSGNRLLYRRVDNPLVELSANDRTALSTALDFYRNCSMMSVPGYLLSMTLELEAPNMFQFRNDNFTRILDDDLVLTIIQALNERRRLLIERRKKRSLTAIPLALETDFLYDRQYLAAWKVSERGLEPVRLRLDEITSLKLGEPIDRITSTNTERLREIVLRVTFDNDTQRREREQIIRQPWAEILSGKLRSRMLDDANEALKNYADTL